MKMWLMTHDMNILNMLIIFNVKLKLLSVVIIVVMSRIGPKNNAVNSENKFMVDSEVTNNETED